jgi:hypothetical protein
LGTAISTVKSGKPVRTKFKIKWTGTIYELMQFLCSIFDFDIERFYHVYTTIRKRAGDRIIYLEKLKEKLIERMEEADNRKMKRR